MRRDSHTHPWHTHSDMKHMKQPAEEEKYTGCLEIGRGKKMCISLMNVSCKMFVAPSSVHHFITIPSKAFFCLSFRRPHSISIQTRPSCFTICHFTPKMFEKPQLSMFLNIKSLGSTALLLLKLCFFSPQQMSSICSKCFVDNFSFF